MDAKDLQSLKITCEDLFRADVGRLGVHKTGSGPRSFTSGPRRESYLSSIPIALPKAAVIHTCVFLLYTRHQNTELGPVLACMGADDNWPRAAPPAVVTNTGRVLRMGDSIGVSSPQSI